MTPPLSVIVLASGDDVGMRSTRPKALHRLCGRPMISYVLDAVAAPPVDRAVVVVGSEGDRVAKTLGECSSGVAPDVVESVRRPGSAAAVAIGLTAFASEDLDDESADVVIAPADLPLLQPATVAGLVAAHRHAGADATLLGVPRRPGERGPAASRGRDGRVVEVVEDPDVAGVATDEITSSVLVVRRSLLGPALRRLVAASERTAELTDVVGVLHGAGYRVEVHVADAAAEVRRVEDRVDLASAEVELRRRINHRWMSAGVTMIDPASTYVDSTVVLARDVTLFPSTMLQGQTTIAEGAELGPDVRLTDTVVGSRARIERTTAVGASIGSGASIGPFVALGPGDVVPPGAAVGSFTRGGDVS